MEKIKVFMKRPDSPKGYMTWISNTLENLQKNVDGYIETVTAIIPHVDKDGKDLGDVKIVVICNEEGRLLNLPYCCTLLGIPFVGTIIVCGVDGEEFADIPITMQEVKAIINR